MKRLVLAGTALALVCAACGSASPPHLKVIAATRERVAAREAKALLHQFAVPPGAVRTRRPSGYGGVLLRSGPTPPQKLVDRFAFWSVGQSFSSVFSYVRAHPPSGFHVEDVGKSSPGQSPVNSTVSWSRQGTRFLNVTVDELPGRVVIRVDAKVAWFRPRSPEERVPRATREIDIRTRAPGPQGGYGPIPTFRRRVVDPAKVAKIIRWFDALPVTPGPPYPMCGPSGGPTVELIFRAANGKRLASASALLTTKASVCDEIVFSIHEQPQTPFVDWPHGPGFVYRVERLLGVKAVEWSQRPDRAEGPDRLAGRPRRPHQGRITSTVRSSAPAA